MLEIIAMGCRPSKIIAVEIISEGSGSEGKINAGRIYGLQTKLLQVTQVGLIMNGIQ